MMTKQNCIDLSDTQSLQSSMPQSWGSWMAAGRLLVAREIRVLKATLEIWAHRYGSRRVLRELDARMLNDIGLTPEQARKEANKPFWVE